MKSIRPGNPRRTNSEPIDKWPRVHSCLYDWCPKRRDECRKCDAVVAILRAAAEHQRNETANSLRSQPRK